MKIRTIEWENGAVKIIDQTKLPEKLVYLRCKSVRQVWTAIRELKVRGAPAIGAAAACGLMIGISRLRCSDFKTFRKKMDELISYLASSRPTAVNLVWALQRMRDTALRNNFLPIKNIRQKMFEETVAIMEEDRRSCRMMADAAQKLIKSGDTLMTYCNAGILATVDYGTALGVIYRAKELKKKIKVYSCETRPLLQGARLTCWELNRNKVDVTLVCDNMAGDLMRHGKIDKIFVGADRIAANGDAANKIGSYSLAVLARFHKVPFYVVAPHSTFDLSLKSGKDIPIEQRSGREVSELWFRRPMTAEGVKIHNPAFDVIPAELISGIVSESGVLRQPYLKKIKSVISCFKENDYCKQGD